MHTATTDDIRPCPCGCATPITFFDANGTPTPPPVCPCGTRMPSLDPEDYETYYDMHITDPRNVRAAHRDQHGTPCYATSNTERPHGHDADRERHLDTDPRSAAPGGAA